MKIKNKRIDYIDIFKALSIILVVIGHINFANTGVKKYIYSFHMPLFFFVYGLLNNYKSSTISNMNLKKRLKSIIVPYFIWALIFSVFSPKNLFYIIYGSHQSLSLCSNSSLWFLPCYFISINLFDLIMEFSKKFQNKKLYIIITLFLLLLLSLTIKTNYYLGIPFGLNSAFMGCFFIILGYYFEKILNIFIKNKSLLIISILISFIITLFYRYNSIDNVLMAENSYGNIFNFFIVSVAGCLLIFSISILLNDIIKNKILRKGLLCLGKNTFVIFAVHKSFISYVEIIFNRLNINLFEPFLLIITLFIVIILCFIVIIIINEYAPILNGKKLKK